MYEVEKDIPVPAPKGRCAKNAIPFNTLIEPGDSFFIPESETKHVNAKVYASRYAKANNVKLSVYVCEAGCRVFRR